MAVLHPLRTLSWSLESKPLPTPILYTKHEVSQRQVALPTGDKKGHKLLPGPCGSGPSCKDKLPRLSGPDCQEAEPGMEVKFLLEGESTWKLISKVEFLLWMHSHDSGRCVEHDSRCGHSTGQDMHPEVKSGALVAGRGQLLSYGAGEQLQR